MIIEKRKWDGSISARWRAALRHEGERLIWVTPAGTRRARPRTGDEEITRCREVSATRGDGWIVTALVDENGRLVRYEVDATVGDETVQDGVVAFIDLDIDVEIGPEGAEVSDLLQFVERRRAMGYPDDLLQRATAALDDARARSLRRDWPFDGSLLQ